MLENIVVGFIIVAFAALTIWGIRVDRMQARLDAEAAKARRTQGDSSTRRTKE